MLSLFGVLLGGGAALFLLSQRTRDAIAQGLSRQPSQGTAFWKRHQKASAVLVVGGFVLPMAVSSALHIYPWIGPSVLAIGYAAVWTTRKRAPISARWEGLNALGAVIFAVGAGLTGGAIGGALAR
jgi:hypothetical protein